MTILSKSAVAAVCGAAVSFGGCYAGGLFSDRTPVEWVSLASSSTFATTYNEATKVGKGYGHYFLDVHGTKGDKNDFNRRKWEELYKRYQEDTKSGSQTVPKSEMFASTKVSGAYQESSGTTTTSEDSKPLNKVCEEAYGKNTSNEVSFEDGNEEKNKTARDMLKYCSPIGQKPVVVGDNSGYENTKVGGGDSKTKLVSLKDRANDAFWEIQNKWFKGLTDSMDAFFKPLKENDKLTVKDACAKAYDATSNSESASTATNPIATDVEKYCSFKSSAA